MLHLFMEKLVTKHVVTHAPRLLWTPPGCVQFAIRSSRSASVTLYLRHPISTRAAHLDGNMVISMMLYSLNPNTGACASCVWTFSKPLAKVHQNMVNTTKCMNKLIMLIKALIVLVLMWTTRFGLPASISSNYEGRSFIAWFGAPWYFYWNWNIERTLFIWFRTHSKSQANNWSYSACETNNADGLLPTIAAILLVRPTVQMVCQRVQWFCCR